jgi:hypothetical protein
MAPPRSVWRDDPNHRRRKGAWLGLSLVDLFEAIHRDRQREELSIRALASRYGNVTAGYAE